MKLILIPLVIMLIASFINQIDLTKSSATVSVPILGTFGGFSGTLVYSVIGILALGVFIAVLSSINVVSTGLTSGAGRLLVIMLVFLGLWIILSASGAALVLAIPSLGIFLYLILTLIYVAGVMQLVSGGGAGAGN